MARWNKGKSAMQDWLRAHVNHEGGHCLIWPFFRDDQGYARVAVEGKPRQASRFMCTLVHGPAPSEKHQAAHSCGNGHGGCVHPKHVWWKTPIENMADAVRHGTARFGSGRIRHKLTLEQVSEIRALKGVMTQSELGSLYGVTGKHIGKIHRGVTRLLGASRPFSPAEVSIIRTRSRSREQFAADYGVSKASIERIQRRKTYTAWG